MFPFNIRLAMAGWKNLFFHPRRFEADPAKSGQWNHGAYLANGPGHCVTCDSLGGAMGEEIEDSTSYWSDADLQAVAAHLLDEENS